MVLSTLLLLSLAPLAALADKDSDFYYSGFTNPNVKKTMYWKDAYNVLDDLDQFSALYITYHNCAHSLYPTNPGSNEDEGNEGYDFWYRNSFPQFLANGAYSLYGILRNGKNGERDGTMCHQGTYINSFFTNRGVETLAYPFGIVDYNGDVPTSQCEGGGGGGEEGGEGHAEESYGLGCYKGQFVYGQFDGSSCGGDIQSVSDYLETFNANMEALECVQIYDKNGTLSYASDDAYGDDAYATAAGDDAYANDGYVAAYGGDDAYATAAGDDAYANDGYVAADGGDDAYNDAGNDDGGRQRRRQEGNEEEGGQYNHYADSDPLDILVYSEACSIKLYGSACPDPFGIKKGFESSLRLSLKILPSSLGALGKDAMLIASLVLLALGVVLFGIGFAIRTRFWERSIGDKEDAFIASKPSQNLHAASKRVCKFQDFSQEESCDETVIELPSKDDSYIQLNNDSPTEEDEPTPIPSPEKAVDAHYEPAVLGPNVHRAAPFPEELSNRPKRVRKYREFAEGETEDENEAPVTDGLPVSVVDSPGEDDSYIQLNNDSPTKEDEATPILRPEKPVLAPTGPPLLDSVELGTGERIAAPMHVESSDPAERVRKLHEILQGFAKYTADTDAEPSATNGSAASIVDSPSPDDSYIPLKNDYLTVKVESTSIPFPETTADDFPAEEDESVPISSPGQTVAALAESAVKVSAVRPSPENPLVVPRTNKTNHQTSRKVEISSGVSNQGPQDASFDSKIQKE